MLRTDADTPWGKEKKGRTGEKVEEGKETASAWIRREREKVQQNMDWREKLRESIRQVHLHTTFNVFKFDGIQYS